MTRKPDGLVLSLFVAVLASGLAFVGRGDAGPGASSPGATAMAITTTAATVATARPTPGPTLPPTPRPTDVPVAPAATPAPIARAATATPVARAATAAPIASTAETPVMSATLTPDPGVVIGSSAEGRTISAYRVGNGALKVALIGDIHGSYEDNTYVLVEELLAYFQAHPAEVPADVSLWLIPSANPDGLANGTRWNGRQVDLNRNTDTDLDGCAGNDWSPGTQDSQGKHPEAGGAYPFSEPEARALRDFLADAQVAVFYHSAAEAIFGDTCARHRPTARLAEVLSKGTGYPVPAEGWDGYPVTGDFGDYMSGEGVAAVTVELSDHEGPEVERNLAGVQAVLASVEEIIAAEATEAGGELVWLAPDGPQANTGIYTYAPGSFVHPQALEVLLEDRYALLLDGGRVMSLDLDQPRPPHLLLAPGDSIPRRPETGQPASAADVRVLEILDLTLAGSALLALDRAGDVYYYDLVDGGKIVERYDRPSGATSDHYYVALAWAEMGSFLLETSHETVWRFDPAEKGSAWASLPKARDVDLAVNGSDVYVLTRAMNNPLATLARYRDGKAAGTLKPGISLMHPRQVQATEKAVYVLDRGGRRLVEMDPASGRLRTIYQFPDRRAVGTVWAGPGGELILAGRDTIYFYSQPERRAEIDTGPQVTGPQSYDPAVLDTLRGLAMPIQGAHLTGRDFQIPGAPRHYRLGVHQGVDFYGYAVGVKVDRSTAVHAVADGVVIRADRSYNPLTRAQAEAWDTECRRLGYTPDDILDGYRGRQVWIEHEGGLVSRYAHLSGIAAGIEVGTEVTRGQAIAQVGNSGTPDGLAGPNVGLHLHLELWLGGNYVGQFMRPLETREWLERILR